MNFNSMLEKKGFSSSISSKFIPAIEGIVTVKVTSDLSFELKVFDDLYLHPAFEVEPGKFMKISKGVSQKSWVTSIYKEVTTEDAFNERILTCIFLKKVQEAYEAGESFVETPAGKFFLVTNRREQKEKFRMNFNVKKFC